MRKIAAPFLIFLSVARGYANTVEFAIANSTANKSKAAVAHGRFSGEYLFAYAKYRSAVKFNPIDIYVQTDKPTGEPEGGPVRILSSGDHSRFFSQRFQSLTTNTLIDTIPMT